MKEIKCPKCNVVMVPQESHEYLAGLPKVSEKLIHKCPGCNFREYLLNLDGTNDALVADHKKEQKKFIKKQEAYVKKVEKGKLGKWEPDQCYVHFFDQGNEYVDVSITPIKFWESKKELPNHPFPENDKFVEVIKTDNLVGMVKESVWRYKGQTVEELEKHFLDGGFTKSNEFDEFMNEI